MKKYCFTVVILKKFTFLIALVLFFSFGCKSQKKSSAQPVKSGKDSLLMSINRYPCFGRCPYYFASIYESGYATIDRKGFMDSLGLYATYFSKTEMQLLLDQAGAINYMALPDSFYNAGIADFPVTVTSVKINGKRKTVFNGVPEVPSGLTTFEKMISDLFTQTQRNWILIRAKDEN